MLVPEADVQSLEKHYSSAGEHLQGSTKELQPVSQFNRRPNLNASMQTCTTRGYGDVQTSAGL